MMGFVCGKPNGRPCGGRPNDKLKYEIAAVGPALALRTFVFRIDRWVLSCEQYHQTKEECEQVINRKMMPPPVKSFTSEGGWRNGHIGGVCSSTRGEIVKTLKDFFNTKEEYENYVLKVSAHPGRIRKLQPKFLAEIPISVKE